jgi:serine/threonine-protein kinase
LPSGHLIYVHQKTLFAVPFDVGRLAIVGSPQPMVADISNAADQGAQFDFSQTGILVYSGAADAGRSLFWLDSVGKEQPFDSAAGIYTSPRFSPDGKHLAFALEDGQGNKDIWVRDLERAAVSRRTFLPGLNEVPVWTPDGRELVFLSSNPAAPGIYSTLADGSGEPQRLTDGTWRPIPGSISPDGKWLAGIVPLVGGQGTEIWTAPLEGSGNRLHLGKRETFLSSPFIKLFPAFSPDGRWLAFNSNETGRHEVYVRPFPVVTGGARGGWQISTDGGAVPIWSPNRRELFFLGAGRIMVVPYKATADSFAAGKPRVWSEQPMLELVSPPYATFDLAGDGRRFAILLYPDGTAEPKPVTHLTFLMNFFDELRRRVPAGAK